MIDRLKEIVGPEYVLTSDMDRALYSYDASLEKALPDVVVLPASTEEVSKIMALAYGEKIPILGRGSGTNLTGGSIPVKGGIVVHFSRMNHMIDVDAANLTITVEAGVKFRDIQARLATEEDRCYLPLEDLVTDADEMICSERSHSGSFLPLDPICADTATIGGVIAANSTGPRRLLYNLPRDMILGIKLVSPGGTVAGAGGKTVKNVSGYDTSKLVVGSMGTLGILCEMTLRLLPLPESMGTVLVSFDAFSKAADLADGIFNSRMLPAAIEVMDATLFGTMTDVAPGFDPGKWVVAVGLEAFSEAMTRMEGEISDMADEIGAVGRAQLDDHGHLRFWLAVSDLLPGLLAGAPGLVNAKLTYPISKWREVVESATRTLSENGIDHGIQAHAGSGICQINLIPKDGDGEFAGRAVKAIGELRAQCTALGGRLFIQQAPVGMKNDLDVWGEPGPEFILIKRLKQGLDPNGIMSPGRFVGGL